MTMEPQAEAASNVRALRLVLVVTVFAIPE